MLFTRLSSECVENIVFLFDDFSTLFDKGLKMSLTGVFFTFITSSSQGKVAKNTTSPKLNFDLFPGKTRPLHLPVRADLI